MWVCVGVLSVGLGPGLDSMSPARSRRSASHAAGTHGWLPPKTGRPGLRRGGVGGYNLQCSPEQSPRLWHTNHEQAVSVWCSNIWSSNASETNINKLQRIQNTALRIATGCTHDTNCTTKLTYYQYTNTYNFTHHKAQHPTHPLHKLTIHPYTPRLKKTHSTSTTPPK